MGIDSQYCRAGWGLVLALMAMLAALGWAGSAAAATHEIGGRVPCHAVSSEVAPLERVPARYTCGGEPAGYQQGSLWLHVDLHGNPQARSEPAVLVHNSRFDRLEVCFAFADGAIVRQQVRSGDFGSHWRAGAQIAFSAPRHGAPVTGVTLRFDRLASANMLRIRLAGPDAEEEQSTVLAAAIGSALMLLLVGATFNASLSIVARRQFSAWQAGWAAVMLLWGACWSQLLLLVLPAMAGAPSAQVCTGLACLATMLATMSAVTALQKHHLNPLLRKSTLYLGWTVGAMGVPLSVVRSGPIDLFANLLGFLTSALLLAVAACLIQAWRRGSGEARTFAAAWAVPMAVLGFSGFVDTDQWLWGGGSQLLVLFAAAWQTLWLSISASRSYALLRMQRDVARRAEAQAHELARRDPLTGLRNRRGFFEVASASLEPGTGVPVALLLIDVDFFKAINDTHGHDAGDDALVTIARRLARWEGERCAAARIGGEEFAMILSGLHGFALARFAESVRSEIAACDHGEALGRVTVSVGVAEAGAGDVMSALYRRADAALYAAKRQGRDRVVMGDAADASSGRRVSGA
ncbi:GGDEF domain-containing protein [Novosphingobium resinovorum]|nr:GGDEF domain-containing protein [Novosphingobium resinovorum]